MHTDLNLQCCHDSLSAKVTVPLYMFFLDLAFAASFSVTGQLIERGWEQDPDVAPLTVLGYMMVFISIAWMWDTTNRMFNRFDQEDLFSESIIKFMMVGVMIMTLNTRECFFPSLLLDDVLYDHQTACTYFSAGYGACRGLLTALVAYVSFHVREARLMLCRELVLWTLLLPLLVALPRLVSHHDQFSIGSIWAPFLVFIASLIDVSVHKRHYRQHGTLNAMRGMRCKCMLAKNLPLAQFRVTMHAWRCQT